MLDRICVIFSSEYSLNLEAAVKLSFSQILFSLIRVLYFSHVSKEGLKLLSDICPK